tara:strand:+ start:512 stop:1165 length:654 start_codon:yes stop_codon:yes gene_type:complete
MEKTALIVAGGSGERLGEKTPKQFLLIKSKPILMHTIEKFSHLDKIIVVISKNYTNQWIDLCKLHNFKVDHKLVEGGGNRFESVKNGLQHINHTDIVLIHDGVRPLISKKIINHLIKKAEKNKGVLPILPISESIRKVNQNSSNSLNRKNYFIAQTPQCFMFEEILEAYNQKYKDEFTDDASVFEAIGGKIITIEGEKENIKITYPIDLDLAEHLVN